MPAGSLQGGHAAERSSRHGSAQLIYLVCEALLDPGDIVLVESPTYFVFLGPVETRGARAIRIPIDDGGLRLDRARSDACPDWRARDSSSGSS